jgi:disulfide bond formation protein DsbB
MKKIFSFFIESVFWIQIFLAPAGIGCLIALFIYIGNQKLLWLSITIAVISIIIGVIYAERVRKKHGTSRYVSKRLATPDIWPDEYPEEIEAREKEQQLKETKKGK